MQRGKYLRRKKHGGRKLKSLALALSSALLLMGMIGSTLAYMTTYTTDVMNTFNPSAVPNSVVDMDSTVVLKNDGNIDAYLRAEVVFNWVEQNSENVIYGKGPVESQDYHIDWFTDGWKQGKDGYFYYLTPIAPGQTTKPLFKNCESVPANIPSEYEFVVHVVGQTIQAKGTDSKGVAPVEIAWGVSIADDGTLIVE